VCVSARHLHVSAPKLFKFKLTLTWKTLIERITQTLPPAQQLGRHPAPLREPPATAVSPPLARTLTAARPFPISCTPAVFIYLLFTKVDSG